jgi:hypothetical protein
MPAKIELSLAQYAKYHVLNIFGRIGGTFTVLKGDLTTVFVDFLVN